MSQTFAPNHWMATRGAKIKVVVLDNGIFPEPDVSIVQIINFIPGESLAARHGTVMSRIIASRSLTQCGIAPDCSLYVGKVIGNNRNCSRFLLNGLEWASSIKADVICMAFAYSDPDSAVASKLFKLASGGCLCIAAHNTDLRYPHTHPGVISAAPIAQAANADLFTIGRVSRQTCDGPGEDFVGSSVSTAMMSGVAACAKAFDPLLGQRGFLDHFNGNSIEN